ncbi:MAG TPA: hypothetical protein P5572_21265 [Phycisphaerae bacterium]|nr:hypothetical protein [Phycisphaerales bacterium]HRX87564.1 hypothetical protein [Phycisphaerae bacterium]
MKPGRLNRIVVATSVIVLLGLTGLYLRDALITNRMVARIANFPPGTPFADVTAANGDPDRVDEVTGSWKWGRRVRPVPENVTHVAVYNRAIAPQICAFLLDAQNVVVEVDCFAGY